MAKNTNSPIIFDFNCSMKSSFYSPDYEDEFSFVYLTSKNILYNTYKLNPVSTIKLLYSNSYSLFGSGS